MFLLIQHCADARRRFFYTLHSTMFLLIRTVEELQSMLFSNFTFHNVSINTGTRR